MEEWLDFIKTGKNKRVTTKKWMKIWKKVDFKKRIFWDEKFEIFRIEIERMS